MAKDARAYGTTLLTVWVILPVIAYFYSHQQNIPASIAGWLLAALMVEVAFYLTPGFTWTRDLLESVEPVPIRAFILTITALIPYLIYALGTATFHWRSFALLAIIATVVSAWFVAQKSTFGDLAFVGIVAAVLLSKALDTPYVTLAKKADAPILGTLMLIRVSALSVITIRKMPGVNFGFIPKLKDWLIGFIAFAAFIPVVLFTNTWLHAVTVRLAPGPLWRVAATGILTFLAFLWVGSLFEELLCRGIVQQTLSKRLGAVAGLVITSMLFGLAHLPFRFFPNWKWVVVATILGIFCGLAYQRAGNIRAAVVTHALVVASWRVFFA